MIDPRPESSSVALHMSRFTGILALLVLYLGGAGPAESLGTCAGDEPRTIEEGAVRLEALLGRFDPDNNRQVRFEVGEEIRTRPTTEQSEILIVSRGLETYGNPYRLGESLAFDQVEQIRRTVYDLDGQGA